jgi:hypothetical protein
MLIFLRAAMTWHRHAPKKQCATIRISCWQSTYSQQAMRLPDALSQHRKALPVRANAIPTWAFPIWEVWHHFVERRTWPRSPTGSAKRGFWSDHAAVCLQRETVKPAYHVGVRVGSLVTEHCTHADCPMSAVSRSRPKFCGDATRRDGPGAALLAVAQPVECRMIGLIRREAE